MAIYQKVTCGNCGHVLQRWEGKWIAIGCPLINCPKCGSGLRHPNVNEWESLDIIQKLGHFTTHLYTSLLYGLGIVVVLYLALSDWLGCPRKTVSAITVGAVSLLGIARAGLLAREIHLSKQRLRDPDYRQRLGRIGLVTPK